MLTAVYENTVPTAFTTVTFTLVVMHTIVAYRAVRYVFKLYAMRCRFSYIITVVMYIAALYRIVKDEITGNLATSEVNAVTEVLNFQV